MAIYLDGHATTPLAPEAREAMFNAWSHTANANSPHLAGELAARVVDTARRKVGYLIGADPSEIVFTSGATEANNLTLLGVARAARSNGDRRHRVIVSAIEHKAVLEPARTLSGEGFEILEAPVDRQGRVDRAALAELLDAHTLLVSVMAANNEIGVIQPLKEVTAMARHAGALIHTDAAQAVGKIALDVFDLDVDYMSISAHKLYGPCGIGALYVSASAPRPQPLMFGGGHEGGLRPGTLPVPLISGFGAAAEVAMAALENDAQHARALARRFMEELANRQVRFGVLCAESDRLPGSLSLQIPGIEAEDLVRTLAPDVLLSTGSACNSGQVEPSHVLRAIGLMPQNVKSTIRVLFGRYNSSHEATKAAALMAHGCAKVLAPGGCHQ